MNEKPTQGQSMAYWLAYFMDLTIEQFEEYLEIMPLNKMTVKERSAYNYASEARTNHKVAKEVFMLIKDHTWSIGRFE